MKKNKLLAVFLALAMTLSLLPTAALAAGGTGTEADPYLVSSDTELITAVEKGGYIKLSGDVTVNSTISVNHNTVIDLASHNLTSTYDGSGTNSETFRFGSVASLAFKNGNIVANNYTAYNKAVMSVTAGCTLTLENITYTTNATALFPYGDAAALNVTNSTISAQGYCMGTNAGSDSNYNVIITLGNSTFNGGDGAGTAMYINVPGTLDMTNCQVNGYFHGLIVRGGTATIKDSIITNTLDFGADGQSSAETYAGYFNSRNWGQGNMVTLAALTLGNKVADSSIDYQYPTSVTLSNTKVITAGRHGDLFPAVYSWANKDAANGVTFESDSRCEFNGEIKFDGPEGNARNTIVTFHGGSYTDLADAIKYSVSGSTIKLLDDVDGTGLGVQAVNGLTLDLNSHTLSANNFSLIFEGSDFTIKNGTLSGKGGSYALFIGDEHETENIAVENVELNGGINIYNAHNVVLRNADITGTTYYAVWCDENAQAVIESGTYQSNGVTVLGMASGIYDTKLEVKGGQFTENGKPLVLQGNDYNTPIIIGGTFSTDPGAYVAEGYAATETEGAWTVAKKIYTVTFESNGGSAVAAINDVAHGTAIPAPTAPTKDGYTFAGWYVGDTEYNFTTPVTAAVTLTAHWTINTYTVTFNSNGGSAVAAIENVAHGTAVSAPTAPTRSGYTFAGWQLNSSDYEFSTPVTENITLIAKWTEIPSTPSDSDSSDDDRDSTTPSQPTISTETKPDGSTTTTESKPDGTVTESNTSKPTTDADGNTSQTTTETSTGKDGVTESKTETVTKPDGSASSTTEATTTKPDGTTTESKTETSINADGSTASTTTETTTNKDGTVTESKTEATTSTVTNKDGSTTETKQETTTTSTGSKTESTTVTTVNKDGSSTATTTATTTDKAGTVTESKTESTTNKNGTTTEKTTTTETKANGTVTESKTETTINADGSSKATTTETVTKADGTKVESKTTATTSLSTNRATGTVTETKKESTTTSDGVKSEGTTVTQIQKDGTVTSKETVKASDSTGTTATKTTTLDAKGNVTTAAEAAVSAKAVAEAAKTGGAVTIPLDVTATKSASTAPTVSVSVPKTAESVKVELPVQNVTPGTVAVIVNADGTEKIVSTSVVTENGVALTLDGSATVKLVDNAKSFVDVPETNAFYNEISSLSARNIMIGVSNEKFDLHNSVTLNQVANVAGRITGEVDVNDFNAGVVWGNENGLKTGSTAATRGEVLKALYVAAGSPAVGDTSILSRFKDASSIPADLAAIAAWAAQNGILKGNMDGTAALSANVTRGQACALAGRTMGALA